MSLILDNKSLNGINIDKAINNLTNKSPKARDTQGIPVKKKN